MQVSQFTIAHRAPGVKDPDAVFPGWWKTDSRDIAATGSYYGDRFYNQFANDLIAQGYSGEELLNQFRSAQKKIRPAVEQILEEAERAAASKTEYASYEDVFGEEDRA